MAHIANCLADHEAGCISKPSSPVLSGDSAANDNKPFTFRMQHPEQPRRYQIFPKEKPLPALNNNKLIEAGAALNQNAEKTEKPSAAAGLKIKISQQNLIRRRKVSVPELGPMTTVQEISMDSPTIPGRPPLHERSISAPGHTSRNRRGTNDLLAAAAVNSIGEDFAAAIEAAIDTADDPLPSPPAKQLARLVIPENRTPQLSSIRSCGHLRSGSNSEPRSGRTESSPRSRTPFTPSSFTPSNYTPNSALTDLTTPRSACTPAAPATVAQAPASAVEISRASPKPWERRCMTPAGTERTIVPQADDPVRSASALGHRRGGSESSSMMDRGRPRKRLQHNASMSDLKSAATRSTDRKAFEELPKGYKPSEASNHLNAQEIESLLKQAMGQAERFEVLSPDDVEHLSKELRRLDERTEYLRRTYNSLRSGRRNLHSRICQYLRSPRVAKFSHDSMLKQEEALAELDASIDDWVSKLEKAENRRTRVRQKLLEHVAAATLLPNSPGATQASGSLQQVMGIPGTKITDVATPPRSPSKQAFSPRNGSTSPSPQRVVAQVPSTIMENPIEEATERLTHKSKSLKRGDVESIRIYAGDDVYALLADVENEISKMSGNIGDGYMANVSDSQRTEIHRQQSHEMLNGTVDSKKDIATPLTPPAPTPPMKDNYGAGDILLTNAVFKP